MRKKANNLRKKTNNFRKNTQEYARIFSVTHGDKKHI